MSKENYFIKDYLKITRELLVKDLRNLGVPVIGVGLWVLIFSKIFHTACPVVLLTGFPCPGCGMTRAFLAIAKGDFGLAFRMHPFSYVLLIYVFCVAFRRYILHKEVKSMIKYLIIIFISMIVYYIYRMIRYFPGYPPMDYFKNNLGYRIVEKLGDFF